MPLYRDFSDDKATILVWKYDESEELDSASLLEEENYQKVKDYHPIKLKELLLVRKILKSVIQLWIGIALMLVFIHSLKKLKMYLLLRGSLSLLLTS